MIVIRRPLTTNPRVHSQCNPRRIVSGLSGKATGSFPNTVGLFWDFSPHTKLIFICLVIRRMNNGPFTETTVPRDSRLFHTNNKMKNVNVYPVWRRSANETLLKFLLRVLGFKTIGRATQNASSPLHLYCCWQVTKEKRDAGEITLEIRIQE